MLCNRRKIEDTWLHLPNMMPGTIDGVLSNSPTASATFSRSLCFLCCIVYLLEHKMKRKHGFLFYGTPCTCLCDVSGVTSWLSTYFSRLLFVFFHRHQLRAAVLTDWPSTTRRPYIPKGTAIKPFGGYRRRLTSSNLEAPPVTRSSRSVSIRLSVRAHWPWRHARRPSRALAHIPRARACLPFLFLGKWKNMSLTATESPEFGTAIFAFDNKFTTGGDLYTDRFPEFGCAFG